MKHARIHLVMGARPNFMKVAPLYHELRRCDWAEPVLVHTGQHYDDAMSSAFLADLGLPAPHVDLGVGSASHAVQTGRVMAAYEQFCLRDTPDWTVVVGDVNSTLACALTAKKLHLQVAHLEAGLRSNDRTMPEEINRVCTDAISDLLWTPSPDADANLLREGAAEADVVRIGNIMIDSLVMMRPRIEQAARADTPWKGLERYGVVTLHRPSNVDDPVALGALAATLADTARSVPLFFPLHPRTAARLREFGLYESLDAAPGMHLGPPLGYLDFMAMVLGAAFVATDSGGLQEETTFLGIPCLTVRENTERPITVTQGTNRLIRPQELEGAVLRILGGGHPAGKCPELWDGRAAGRAVESLARRIS